MRTLALAGAFAVLSSAAMAEDFSVIGNTEYAVEAAEINTNIGVEVIFGNLIVSPLLNISGSTDSIGFAGVELNAIYAVNSTMNLYGKIEADDEFGYDEATVGVAFRF